MDIAPTILRELHIDPKKEQLWELDGVPLTGPISVANGKAVLKDDELHLTWESFGQKGKLNIYITTTNLFAQGGQDKYIVKDRVELKSKKAVIDISDFPANFYKVIFEGEYNIVNTWVAEWL